MKKRLLGIFVMISICLLNITPLMAATTYKLDIVKQNQGKKQLSTSGANILNTINLDKSDFAKGKVAVDVIINNSKSVSIMYAVDNSSSMQNVKSSLASTLTEKYETLGNNYPAVAQGISYRGILNETENTISMSPQVGTTGNIFGAYSNEVGIGEDGSVFIAMDSAVRALKDSGSESKILVVFVGNMGTEDESTLKTTIDSYINNDGINIVAYGVNLSDTTSFDNVFANATRYNVTTDTLSNINLNELMATENTGAVALNNVAVNISFDTYILDNFDINNVTVTQGEAAFADNEINWGADNIDANKTVTLSYELQLKSNIDTSLVNKATLRTSRQIKVYENASQLIGIYPSDDEIEDSTCSPQIKIISGSVTNPNTGIADYIIPAACLMAVALITIVILNSKNEFNRI
ncbi:MAG: hypothetical protein MR779_03775 [Tenericutes bacterium]|nr:hypothetical protein [Mycoplasmatota bacterium]